MKLENLKKLARWAAFGLMSYISGAYSYSSAEQLVYIQANDGIGDYATDKSSYNNSASLHNVNWRDGKSGFGLYFDGQSSYADLKNDQNNPLYDIHKGNFSVAAWIKPTQDLPWRSGLITRWGVHQGLFYTRDNHFAFIHRLPSGNQTITSIKSYPPGTFYHVVVSANGALGELKMYINGQLANTVQYAPEQASYSFYRPWRLGIKAPTKTSAEARENFSGIIDEVRFFNVALTSNEIEDIIASTENTCDTPTYVPNETGIYPAVLSEQDFISFEQTEVPSQWSAETGHLSITEDKFKHGHRSLNWNWNKGDTLTVINLQSQGLEPNKIDKTNYTQSSFRLWLYNETPLEETLRVEFYDESAQRQYFYPVNLNFKGWRAASVRYRTDMLGNKFSQNLTTMKIHAPTATCSGNLKIDLVDFTAPKTLVQGGDHQVPMAASDIDNHWTNMLKYEAYSKLEQTIPSHQQLIDSELMKNSYRNIAIKSKGSIDSYSGAITQFNELGIVQDRQDINAQVTLFGPHHIHKTFGIKIDEIDSYIMVFAREYINNSDETAKSYFITLIRYMLNQGFADGSMMENMSHVGYSVRNITDAILLMETPLKEAGMWQQAWSAISWYNALEKIWQPVSENESNVDHANTRLSYILGIILHIDDEPTRIQYLKGYTQHIETWLTAYNRGQNGLKPDFSAFHHNTFYPGYVYGAMNSIAKAVNHLANSEFAISAEKFEFLAKAVASYNVHHVNRDMPISISGRNPWKTPALAASLTSLAQASNNDKFYQAYNRLFGENGVSEGKGIEKNPEGFWQFNYRPMGVYRQDNWVANIKGMSQYFWGSEIYSSQNRYGRYQSYGSIILNYQLPEAMRSSSASVRGSGGYTESGWNWNIVPGATTKHLSWPDLLAESSRQDEWNDEKFAGSLRFGNNSTPYVDDSVEGECGIFGLNFKQLGSTSTTHEDSFTFKKSVFACNHYLISLGSSINSYDAHNPIATNLFQQSLTDAPYSLQLNWADVKESQYNYLKDVRPVTQNKHALPRFFRVNNTVSNWLSGLFCTYSKIQFIYNWGCKAKQGQWLTDLYGTGYYIKQGGQLNVSIKNQQSPKQNSNDFTQLSSGHFATAWLNHGKAPDNQQYEYVIVPNAHKYNEPWPAIVDKINRSYQVMQQDDQAHIVYMPKQKLESYVVFSPGQDFNGKTLVSTNAPILLMSQRSQNRLALSLANPDHNFTGKAPRWGENKSSIVTIEIKGIWDISTRPSQLQNVQHTTTNTLIQIETINASAVDLLFIKANQK